MTPFPYFLSDATDHDLLPGNDPRFGSAARV
jgi:hypothetical protein